MTRNTTDLTASALLRLGSQLLLDADFKGMCSALSYADCSTSALKKRGSYKPNANGRAFKALYFLYDRRRTEDPTNWGPYYMGPKTRTNQERRVYAMLLAAEFVETVKDFEL